MKIFWSWQSDTDGKTGRHFVRNALNAAIKQLKQQEDVEEPNEAARRQSLHSDAGVEGIPGSPEIAREILKKISTSQVIIADVTPVGKSSLRKDEHGKSLKPKALMNPNVAIELGYGMARLPENHFLMVMNTHYGDRSSVPFDLAGRNGPIMYNLAPDATKEQIEGEQSKLRGTFVQALREFLKLPASAAERFKETPTTINKASYWTRGETLVRLESDLARFAGKTEIDEYRFNSPVALYLRIIPTVPRAEALKYIVLRDAVNKRPRVMTRTIHGCLATRNKYGAIAYETENEAELKGFVQLFLNGEIWCVSRDLTRTFRDKPIIPVQLIERVMTDTLSQLLLVAKDNLKIAPPYRIVMGAVGIKEYYLGIDNNYSDVIHVNEVEKDCIVSDTSNAAALNAVEGFLEELCDKAGEVYTPGAQRG